MVFAEICVAVVAQTWQTEVGESLYILVVKTKTAGRIGVEAGIGTTHACVEKAGDS